MLYFCLINSNAPNLHKLHVNAGLGKKSQIRHKVCYSLLSLFSYPPHLSVPKAKIDSWTRKQILISKANTRKKKHCLTKHSKKGHILPLCCQMLSYMKSVWKKTFTKHIYSSHWRLQNPTMPMRLNLNWASSCLSCSVLHFSESTYWWNYIQTTETVAQ